ncbi:MAG: hypothetical protein V3U20_03585 [Thermoplasmata archaeon]
MTVTFDLPECHGVETAKHWESHKDIFDILGRCKSDEKIVEGSAAFGTAGYTALLNEILKEHPDDTLFPNPDQCKNCDVNISCAVTALNIICRSFKMKND